jgi:23S rRNA (guanosine2251-2'-O)-methyltransferase
VSGRPERDVLFGRQPLLAALRDGVPLNRILVAKGQRVHGTLATILELARAAGVPVAFVERAVLDRYGAHHQGCAAFRAATGYADLADLVQSAAASCLVLVLDGIVDPHNLGAIARSAEAFGAQGLVVPKRHAAGITGAAMKASAGALLHLPVVRVANLSHSLDVLRAAGYWCLAAAPGQGRPLRSLRLEGRVAAIVGSEGRGVRPLLLQRADEVVHIPLAGRTASLNASVAAAVILYEWACQNCRQSR